MWEVWGEVRLRLWARRRKRNLFSLICTSVCKFYTSRPVEFCRWHSPDTQMKKSSIAKFRIETESRAWNSHPGLQIFLSLRFSQACMWFILYSIYFEALELRSFVWVNKLAVKLLQRYVFIIFASSLLWIVWYLHGTAIVTCPKRICTMSLR